MANENVSVSGPVEIKTDSKARVALDLMKHIDYYSELKSEQKSKCPVPCDHIPVRSWPLFTARRLMRDVIESLQGGNKS